MNACDAKLDVCARCAMFFHHNGGLPPWAPVVTWRVAGDPDWTELRTLDDAIAAAALQPSGALWTDRNDLLGNVLTVCAIAGTTLCRTHAAQHAQTLLDNALRPR